MPEVGKTYLFVGGISDIAGIYQNIGATYVKDVGKYAKNKTDNRVIKNNTHRPA